MKAFLQQPQRPQIAVIVVIVTQKHEGYRRQIVEPYAGRPGPPRSRERDRAGSLVVDRIDQHAGCIGLNQKSGVTYEGHHRLAWSRLRRPLRLDRHPRGPFGPGREQQARHSPEWLPIGAIGIEESAAIEMIGPGWHAGE